MGISGGDGSYNLGSPVVPFYPFSFWVPLLKPNSRKKGTLIIKGLLGNLVMESRDLGYGNLRSSGTPETLLGGSWVVIRVPLRAP